MLEFHRTKISNDAGSVIFHKVDKPIGFKYTSNIRIFFALFIFASPSMRGKFFTALLFLGMIMWAMPVVQVSADSMHSHEMVSPFQKHEHGNHPHCDLSKRYATPVFCPLR